MACGVRPRKDGVRCAENSRRLREALAGVEAARAEDRLSYARARDAGEGDPGPAHERAADAALLDARRRLEGEALRVERAEADLQAALAANVDAWDTAISAALDKAERNSLAAVEKLEVAERHRAALRAAAGWIARLKAGQPTNEIGGVGADTPLRRNMSGDRFSVAEVLDAVRAAIEDTGVEAQRRRAAERDADQAEAEAAREEHRRMHERAVPQHRSRRSLASQRYDRVHHRESGDVPASL